MRSPLGSISRQGTPAVSASSMSTMPRPVLPGAGHAHDHAVGREIAGPHHRRGAVALVRGRVDQLAEVEVSHGGDCRPGRATTGRRRPTAGRPAKQPALPFASMTFRGWPADAFDFYRGPRGRQLEGLLAGQQAPLRGVGRRRRSRPSSASSTRSSGRSACSGPTATSASRKDKSPYKTAAAASSEGERGTGLLRAGVRRRPDGRVGLLPHGLRPAGEVPGGGRRRRRRRGHRHHLARRSRRRATRSPRSSSSRPRRGATPRTTRASTCCGARGWWRCGSSPRRAGCTPPRRRRGSLDTWRDEQPMHDWLDAHVGPSELPPPDAEW